MFDINYTSILFLFFLYFNFKRVIQQLSAFSFEMKW